jgi:hypothetical protein
MNARELFEAGPRRDDPFTIADQIGGALPGDRRAATLGDTWRDELRRLEN